ncbi:microsomal glutathione S-transferase 1-like [Ischnura elegans]|uniref:microsomal glutathione S-transferase 1-like n=1 Tax=Ischnura elegans TaxID=197161 RepID=UPI001ED86C5F|nr:microsomal glutathione S-transferase 1-like [Ischnura elegans]
MDVLDRDDPVFSAYALYSVLLAFKMYAVFFLIARLRFKKKVFISPEDTTLKLGSTVRHDDPDIERARRAQLNDLENIPIFWIIGLLYTLTKPEPLIAVNIFRIYFFARAIHTFVYAFVVFPQPARALSFFVGFAVTVYMTVEVFLYFV